MDKALKQRLVGASVLIILAVIVLPMLLSGRSDRLKNESSQIELPPKPDELSIETRRFPVGMPNRPAPAAGAEVVETAEPAPQMPRPSEEVELASPGLETREPVPQLEGGSGDDPEISADALATPPVVTPITLTSQKPESLEISDALQVSADAPRYLVQVASFSNERNANTLADLLKAENLPVLLDLVERPAGRMYRVRVGPYEDRPEADAVVSSLAGKMKDLNPRVLDLRPDESSPVSTPSDPLVRWVVQVGSFSSPQSAEDLVAQLRLAGLSAYSEKVSATGGSVYKVRVGPELDRERAAETARRIKADHKLDAFVTTQD